MTESVKPRFPRPVKWASPYVCHTIKLLADKHSASIRTGLNVVLSFHNGDIAINLTYNERGKLVIRRLNWGN